jgi:hypothetical protein
MKYLILVLLVGSLFVLGCDNNSIEWGEVRARCWELFCNSVNETYIDNFAVPNKAQCIKDYQLKEYYLTQEDCNKLFLNED